MAFTLLPSVLLFIGAVPYYGTFRCEHKSKPEAEHFAKCYLASLDPESRNYFRKAEKCSGIKYTQFFYENQCLGDKSPAVMKFYECMTKNFETLDFNLDKKKFRTCIIK